MTKPLQCLLNLKAVVGPPHRSLGPQLIAIRICLDEECVVPPSAELLLADTMKPPSAVC